MQIDSNIELTAHQNAVIYIAKRDIITLSNIRIPCKITKQKRNGKTKRTSDLFVFIVCPSAMTSLGEKMIEEEIREMIAEVNHNWIGKIVYEELVLILSQI